MKRALTAAAALAATALAARQRLLNSGSTPAEREMSLPAPKLLDWLVWDPAHLVMQLRQFHGLRERAERAASRSPRSSEERSGRSAGNEAVTGVTPG